MLIKFITEIGEKQEEIENISRRGSLSKEN